MHQQIRAHQRVASPASAAQTNVSRTNNPREGGTRSRAGSALSNRDVAISPTSPDSSEFVPRGESVRKLDQIIQNIHTKVAGLVLPSRTTIHPTWLANGTKKTSKWFQLDTEEFDDFRDELRTWKTCGSFENRPPPLLIDVYLDTSSLKTSESLVLVDDVSNKRWDVVEALDTTYDSLSGSSRSSSGGSPKKTKQVILERWRIELKPYPSTDIEDFGPILPTIYKKAIVFIRSIFTFVHLTPCWKLVKQSRSKTVHPALIPHCRIRMAEPESPDLDYLRKPITTTGSVRPGPVQEFVFGDLDVPVGRFYASVMYRTECACNFRVDDSESLLSSRFMGIDENFFTPSVPQPMRPRSGAAFAELGSLPTQDRRTAVLDVQQTYGSLSTFHGDGPLGTSPLSALRAVRAAGSDTSSPPSSLPTTTTEQDVPHSLPSAFITTTPKAPFRIGEGHGRRPSISFQPFKSGSLSVSPAPREGQAGMEPPSSPHSLSRATGLPTLSQPRNRSSLTAGMAASLRGIPPSQDQLLASSPRNASGGKYSSSFSHRRGRPSISGTSRVGDDEQGSSGRQSLSSSVAQPGSGFLTEAPGTSSGSLQMSDDNIKEFLKVLDSKRTLKSFEASKKGESALNRTVAQLGKFHMMKESNNALGESLTSSMQMQRSSSSSSRQLSSVPGMAPASISTSSSPGKPLSPHTPHTPAIPSRLSENSIIEYSQGQQLRGTAIQPTPPQIVHSGPSQDSTFAQDGTTAIDIPLSPRLGFHARRASSVARQSRITVADDDNPDPTFLANRSISLGADDREPPTISMLLRRQTDGPSASQTDPSLRPAAEIEPIPVDITRQLAEDTPMELPSVPPPSTSPYGRRRYLGMGVGTGTSSFGGRGQTPPHPSRGSSVAPSRNSNQVNYNENADEEPIVFDMSEMDAQIRRSLEDGRGGGTAGSYESRGLARRAW